jgi:hypothetical protein
MELAVGTHVLQFFLELVFLPAQQTPVDLDLLLALTALLHAALLPGEVSPLACQARQVVLDLRQLDLQTSFSRVRTLAEDNQNQGCPIEDLRLECSLQRAMLPRRQFKIKNDTVTIVKAYQVSDFLYFS